MSLALYPALADGSSPGEQEALKGIVEGMEGVEPAQIIDAISQKNDIAKEKDYLLGELKEFMQKK